MIVAEALGPSNSFPDHLLILFHVRWTNHGKAQVHLTTTSPPLAVWKLKPASEPLPPFASFAPIQPAFIQPCRRQANRSWALHS